MLIVYIHLDMYLGYVKAKGELPRTTRLSSRPRPIEDLFVSVTVCLQSRPKAEDK